MAFKKVLSLDTDTRTALGGTRKDEKGRVVKNPTTAEGYYLGSKDEPSKKSKTGFSKVHVLQTDQGTLGVYGKTDLDRKMRAVTPGHMTRITYTGMKETQNNPMYVYLVESDAENTIDVDAIEQLGASDDESEYNSESSYDDAGEESAIDEEETPVDEVPPARATPPKTAAKVPSAASRAAVLEKLKARGSSKAA